MCDGEMLSALAAEEDQAANLSNKPIKRRSLIFQRRSINHHAKENFDDTCYNKRETVDEQSKEKEVPEDKDNFNLSNYITSLRNEREEWRKTLNERKSKRRRLAKEEISIGDECELDLSVLTDYERSFVSSRPNYHRISKNIDNLIPIAVKIATLNEHIDHLNKNLVESMEEKNVELTKQVTQLTKE